MRLVESNETHCICTQVSCCQPIFEEKEEEEEEKEDASEENKLWAGWKRLFEANCFDHKNKMLDLGRTFEVKYLKLLSVHHMTFWPSAFLFPNYP